MEVKEVKKIKVKYFKVINKGVIKNNLTETDCFNYYKELGYRVYSDYSFYFRKKVNKQINSHNQYIDRKELRELKPKFDHRIKDLFKDYKDGEPDLLVEKGGIWEFIEVKTTNDSLRPNQLEFLEQLNELATVSIHYFIDVENNNKNKKINPRKDRGKIKINFNNEYFENELLIFSNIANKKNYNKYFPVAQIYKNCPEYPYDKEKIELIEKYTGLSRTQIKWFLDKNAKKISIDTIRKITKQSKLTPTNNELLLKHKELISKFE